MQLVWRGCAVLAVTLLGCGGGGGGGTVDAGAGTIDADCTPIADGPGAMTETCAPVGSVAATFFHDSGCMQGELA